jgi:hypothetical protein
MGTGYPRRDRFGTLPAMSNLTPRRAILPAVLLASTIVGCSSAY